MSRVFSAQNLKQNDPARNGFGVAGGTEGVNAGLNWDPRSGYTVIVLSNYDPPIAETIAHHIRALLPQK